MGPGGFPVARPGTGGMMPGMPGAKKIPAMPGLDTDDWEVPRSRSIPRGKVNGSNAPTGRFQSSVVNKSPSLSSKYLPQGTGGVISGKTSALLQGSDPSASQPPFVEPVPQPSKPIVAAPEIPVPEKVSSAPLTKPNLVALRKKTISLLEEYFSVRILDEALQCVEELQAPDYHPEVVKEAIALALEKIPPCVDPVSKLIEFLLTKNVLTTAHIGKGCLLYGSLLDDIGIDLPKAPNNFGEVVGRLVVGGGLDFKVVNEILTKVEDDYFRKTVFDAALRSIKFSPSGQDIISAQGSEFQACESLVS